MTTLQKMKWLHEKINRIEKRQFSTRNPRHFQSLEKHSKYLNSLFNELNLV